MRKNLNLENYYKQNGIHSELFNFSNNILEYFSKVDFVITRSGSSMISELLNCSVPLISIPFPYATDDHQSYNAKYFEEKGFCWVLEQKFFNIQKFQKMIIDIVANDRKQLKIKLENMKTATKENVLIKFEDEIKEYF